MAKTNTKTARKAPKIARTKKTGAARKPAPKRQSNETKAAKARPESKQAIIVAQMQRKDGATVAELVRATGWQAHSVRGAISGALKKKLGLAVTSEKIEGRGRVYRVAAKA